MIATLVGSAFVARQIATAGSRVIKRVAVVQIVLIATAQDDAVGAFLLATVNSTDRRTVHASLGSLETEAPGRADVNAWDRPEMIGRHDGALLVASGTGHASTPVSGVVLVDVGRSLGLLLALLELLARFDYFAVVCFATRTKPAKTKHSWLL